MVVDLLGVGDGEARRGLVSSGQRMKRWGVGRPQRGGWRWRMMVTTVTLGLVSSARAANVLSHGYAFTAGPSGGRSQGRWCGHGGVGEGSSEGSSGGKFGLPFGVKVN
jgi:hypothetical protein